MNPKNRPPNAEAGMTLIEVLVALLIFSFGLLGFVGLQARAIQYSVSAENSNRAALLANEMATTIQLAGPPYSQTSQAAAITAWQARVSAAASAGLPNGLGTVAPVAAGNGATITITWQPPATSTASAAQNRYVTQVIVPAP